MDDLSWHHSVKMNAANQVNGMMYAVAIGDWMVIPKGLV